MTLLTGTPDWQRGVINAQKLLAEVNAHTASVTVGVPPNAESVLVFGLETTLTPSITAVGVTTGFSYPAYIIGAQEFGNNTYAAVIQVSNPVDQQILITCGFSPAVNWYVVADQGVHQVVETVIASLVVASGGPLVNGAIPVAGENNGIAGIPRLTQLGAWQVPGASVLFTGTATNNGTQVLAALTLGRQYYITGWDWSPNTAADSLRIVDNSGPGIFGGASQATAGFWTHSEFEIPYRTPGPVVISNQTVNQGNGIIVRGYVDYP